MTEIGVRFKIVMEITKSNSSVKEILEFLINDVQPALALQLEGNTALKYTERRFDYKMKAWEISPNIYGIYPKVLFNGKTSLTESTSKTDLDVTATDLEATISSQVILFGATILKSVRKQISEPNVSDSTRINTTNK